MRTLSFAILFAALAAPNTCSAQVDEQPVARSGRQKHVEVILERQEALMRQIMEVRVDDIVQVCNLSESQVKRLTIAAKGAVSRCMAKRKKQIEQAMGGRGVGFGPEEEWGEDEGEGEEGEEGKDLRGRRRVTFGVRARDEGEGEEEGQAGEGFGRMVFRGGMIQGGGGDDEEEFEGFGFGMNELGEVDFKSGHKPYREKIWTQELDRLLNDQQRAAYDKHLATRRAFRRAAGVHQFVTRLDRQLFLSTDQRKRMVELVDESIGKSFERNHDLPVMIGGPPMMFRGWEDPRQGLPKEKVKTILSESQYAVWQADF